MDFLVHKIDCFGQFWRYSGPEHLLRSQEMDARKIALVTGAGRRIGRAIAYDLALNGWNIVVHYYKSFEEAEEVVREIRAFGCEASAIKADLSDAHECDGLIDKAVDMLGQLSLLVNCASVFTPDNAQTMTAENFDLQMSVNARAPLQLSRDFATQIDADSQGNIINIIDQRVWRLTPYYMSYTASKFALWGTTKTLAQALAPKVRVNAIGPGPTLANERQTNDEFAAEVDATLLGNGPQLSEFGHAIRFIVDTPSMTGQMIALDGGQHLS